LSPLRLPVPPSRLGVLEGNLAVVYWSAWSAATAGLRGRLFRVAGNRVFFPSGLGGRIISLIDDLRLSRTLALPQEYPLG